MSGEIMTALKGIADRLTSIELQTSKIAAIEESIKELADLKNRMQEMESEQEKIRGSVQQTHVVCDEMRKEMKALSEKVDDLENRNRRSNLVFYGVAEMEREGWSETERIVRDILRSHMDIELHVMDIDRAHRVGPTRGRPRPIVVKFAFYKTKAMILGKARLLQGTRISVAEDFSARVREIRRNLVPHLKEAKRAGCRAVLRYDKLIINGQQFVPPGMGTQASSKKRQRSDGNEHFLTSKKPVPDAGDLSRDQIGRAHV